MKQNKHCRHATQVEDARYKKEKAGQEKDMQFVTMQDQQQRRPIHIEKDKGWSGVVPMTMDAERRYRNWMKNVVNMQIVFVTVALHIDTKKTCRQLEYKWCASIVYIADLIQTQDENLIQR